MIQILEDTTVSSLLELFHTQDDTEETMEVTEKEHDFEDMSNLYNQDIKQFINSLPKSVNYNTILIEKVDCGTMTQNLITEVKTVTSGENIGADPDSIAREDIQKKKGEIFDTETLKYEIKKGKENLNNNPINEKKDESKMVSSRTPFFERTPNGKFVCFICKGEYNSRDGLQSHIRIKHDGVRFSCTQCDYTATRLKHLTDHKQTKHEGVMFKCDKCDLQSHNQNSIRDHKKRKHSGEIQENGSTGTKKLCPAETVRSVKPKTEVSTLILVNTLLNDILTDIWTKAANPPTKSFQFDRTVSSNKTLTSAFVVSGKLSKWQSMKCGECGKTTKTVKSLKKHITKNHLQLQQQCTHCYFVSNIKAAMNQHYRKKHRETIVSEAGVERFDYVQRSSESMSDTFWEREWGIIVLGRTREDAGVKIKDQEKKKYFPKKSEGTIPVHGVRKCQVNIKLLSKDDFKKHLYIGKERIIPSYSCNKCEEAFLQEIDLQKHTAISHLARLTCNVSDILRVRTRHHG